MSPEQARGEALDGRSDQYSLAIVAYKMLTGTTPFRSDTTQPWALVNMHATIPPPDPREYAADLPEHVVNALLQALEKLPGSRFSTCRQFAGAVSGKVKTVPRIPPLDGVLPYIPPVRRSSSLPAILVIIAVLLLIGGGLVLTGVLSPKQTIRVEVCRDSHLLARRDCPRTQAEVFDVGKEPKQECDLHQNASEGILGPSSSAVPPPESASATTYCSQIDEWHRRYNQARDRFTGCRKIAMSQTPSPSVCQEMSAGVEERRKLRSELRAITPPDEYQSVHARFLGVMDMAVEYANLYTSYAIARMENPYAGRQAGIEYKARADRLGVSLVSRLDTAWSSYQGLKKKGQLR